MHSINSFLQFFRVGNIKRRRCSSSLIIIASRSSKHMHIISIKIIMCSSKTQPISIILNKGKLLRYSVVGRIQKDNRTIMRGWNSNNLMFNIRNYSKFISISIIHIGILATSIASIIKKGYFKRINGIITIIIAICWKYALEAIIKAFLLYFLVHDNCILFML